MATRKVGANLTNLPAGQRRAIWRARKQAQRAGLCQKRLEAHHPDYSKPGKVVCVTAAQHRKLPHKH